MPSRGLFGALEEASDGVDAAVVGVSGGHVELGEDVSEVRFDGPAGDIQALGDRGVGEAGGGEGEHLASRLVRTSVRSSAAATASLERTSARRRSVSSASCAT